MSKVAPEPIVEKKDESLSSDNKKKEETTPKEDVKVVTKKSITIYKIIL